MVAETLKTDVALYSVAYLQKKRQNSNITGLNSTIDNVDDWLGCSCRTFIVKFSMIFRNNNIFALENRALTIISLFFLALALNTE